MSDPSNVAEPGAGAAYEPPPSAGAALRSAREAVGLSIDAVAQQLKLAPRQVQALEDDDFAALPGRTFVRGFLRNYARYVGLDPDDVVALLPGADVAPSLSRPTITPSSRPMGHLPADAPPRRSWTGWVIALVLVGIVAAAGVYEFRRPQGDTRHMGVDKTVTALPSAPAAGAAGGSTTSGGTTSSTLPNPLSESTPSTTPPATTSADGTTAAPAAANTATSAATQSSATPAPAGSTAPTAPAAVAESRPAAAAPGDAALVLTFKGPSWAQVKDRNGNVLLAQTFPGGTTQSVSGPTPLDIVIGNATQVTATFRGQNVDLSPHVRGTVARLSIK